MIFSIAMGAEYLSYVKSTATFAPTFYEYIISVLASVTEFTHLYIFTVLGDYYDLPQPWTPYNKYSGHI